eukprot:5462142-Lingulodinium_polyedra.AAC.1
MSAFDVCFSLVQQILATSDEEVFDILNQRGAESQCSVEFTPESWRIATVARGTSGSSPPGPWSARAQ